MTILDHLRQLFLTTDELDRAALEEEERRREEEIDRACRDPFRFESESAYRRFRRRHGMRAR